MEETIRNIEDGFYCNPKKDNENNRDLVLSNMRNFVKNNTKISQSHYPKISVLLTELHLDFDYSKLENIDDLYIPLKYFTMRKYSKFLLFSIDK